MDWSKKQELCELANNATSQEKRNYFNEFVLKNYLEFDSQAWDMFINGVGIIIEEIEADAEFWGIIYPQIERLIKHESLGLRNSYRICLLLATLEELKIINPQN